MEQYPKKIFSCMEKLYEAKSVCVIKLIQENYLPTLARAHDC